MHYMAVLHTGHLISIHHLLILVTGPRKGYGLNDVMHGYIGACGMRYIICSKIKEEVICYIECTVVLCMPFIIAIHFWKLHL